MILKPGQHQLYLLISKNPGITKSEMCGVLGIRRSTLQEKLRVLLAYRVIKEKKSKHPNPHKYYSKPKSIN